MADRKKAAKATETAQEAAAEAQETAEGVQEASTETQEAAEFARYRVTYPYGLNLREGPGKNHAVLRVLPKGAAVQVTGLIEEGLDGVWMQTAEGWVNGAYLAPERR